MAHALIEELATFKKQFKDKAEAALKAEFKAFFERHETVVAVTWKQYTPYFNDGDACTFRVGDPVFLQAPSGGQRDEDEDEDEDNDSYGANDAIYQLEKALGSTGYGKNRVYGSVRTPTPAELSLLADAEALSSLVHGIGDEMESIFGEHVIVKATRAGFDVEEYEHD